MDLLSEILKAVRLEGAFYYNGEFTAPWGFISPAGCAMEPFLSQPGSHVIVYHLLTDGSAFAGLEQERLLPLAAGDIVIFPHGDAHIVSSGTSVQLVPIEANLQQILASGMKVSQGGGGGALTRFVCGYMTCDRQLSQFLLAGLPPFFKVSIRDGGAGDWLENSIRFSVNEVAGSSTAGGAAVLAKLSEVLFVETIRRYIAQLPPGQTGWLAGARDPEIGKALALIHRSPAHPWTIADLAREAGASRSSFAERFRQFVGEPPVAYLTRWRMQLGAQSLRSSNKSVAEIAADVGYESEAAFNRAFKREFNAPPARFRNEARARSSTAARSSAAGNAPQPQAVGYDLSR